MNAPALPAYLQNKARVNLNAIATAGMSGALPPHVSIRGNSYTLIDGSGNQQPVGAMMDACVIDILEHMGKRYYENDWTPGSDEPPTCWSTNGVAPSRESVKPQAQTCATCEWNVRGSETSKISGKGIKACRDEKIVAILLPQYPNMLFQLVVPPGSFKNWSAFTKPFENSGMDVSDVLIRFGFQPQVNGVMVFSVATDQQGNGQYMPEHLVPVFNKALESKATDALVGRNDVPIAITHQPARQASAEETHAAAQTQQAGHLVGGQPQAQVPFEAGAPAPNAGAFGQPAQALALNAETKSPSDKPARTRRTQAQIAADNAAKAAAQAGGVSPAQNPAPVQPTAPFPVNQPQGGFGGAPGNQNGGPAFGGGQPQNPQLAFSAAGPAANPSFGPQGQPSGTPTQQGTPTGFGQGTATTASPSSGQTFGIQQGADPNVDPQLAAMLASLGNPQ